MSAETSNPTQGKSSEPENLDLGFSSSIAEAEKSGVPAIIARAKNGYGSWLMSQDQRRYAEAVPLFRQVAEIQTSQDNRIGAADAYARLSTCLFLVGDVNSLKEAEKAAEKAAELYPDSEDFTDQRTTLVSRRITILRDLKNKTKDNKYFDQGVKLCEQYADILKASKEVWKQFQEDGIAQAA